MSISQTLMLACGALTISAGPALAQQADWASYNRTLTSERFSPVRSISTTNAAKLGEVCRFDTGEATAFQSGLVQVNGALFATTERDTFSIDPDTCALNWRTREDFPENYLSSQRGVAVADGRVFRGARNGSVYAYDEKTGKRLWATEIADKSKGESAPSAPIAWNGLVFIGIAGGDNRGVKGRTYALDAASGKIVWEAYLVPKAANDPVRGPQAKVDAPAVTWQNTAGVEITGGGSWSSYSLDPATGLLYIPGGNPAPMFASHLRKGANLYAGSLVVLDARTGDYRSHYSIGPDNFLDYDLSSAPALFTTRNGTQVIALTPKDGFIYAFERKTGKRLYRLPMAEQLRSSAKILPTGTRFCPGGQGGSQWNGPAFDPSRDAIVSGQVNWCSTIRLDPDDATKAVAAAQFWTGSADGVGKQDDPAKWSGWVTSVDALSGRRHWRFQTPNPVLGAVTPTAGGVTLLGDAGGNFFALNSATGKTLFQTNLKGAIAGGVITYDTGAGQKVAVSTGLTSKIWPTPKATAQIVILGLK
ncbi:outer membrane protein assembly factor BamB family protein [Glacieibacterium frigidum]|uniref:PQQ-binding-like beta-propeller repeat protein n=1 Tax=Glacieibacterium frigidum TaxID=2593303 RepID=A0A552U8C0_9SPHN|nr:PQQ-binding-like beta-propeller repeat protein [Glacieibacterium frigidum]TRW14462.1 PQQ-binding-like beta-propeller repeat protein [Glacieibacterium frigidum]